MSVHPLAGALVATAACMSMTEPHVSETAATIEVRVEAELAWKPPRYFDPSIALSNAKPPQVRPMMAICFLATQRAITSTVHTRRQAVVSGSSGGVALAAAAASLAEMLAADLAARRCDFFQPIW